ncbi:hypothetical protein EVAR_48762_1 [Eumeta japonica]|uniref:Uncharacterized protein n=1 Tax=Eumeta variegata TaxID=151549 RepID=A0A4C1YFD2_EUMVA|nr:hypothetical protein EVAR_48762_1 [Eumeta japonica]
MGIDEADVSRPPYVKYFIDRHLYAIMTRAASQNFVNNVDPKAFSPLTPVIYVALLATLKVAYHTYTLKEEREFHVVLRGHRGLPIEEVKEDLLAEDLPVQSVCLITNRAREPPTCTRIKDTDGPPACEHCKSSGHTANYLGFPRVPKRKIIIPKNKNNKKALPPRPIRPRPAEGPCARSQQICHTRK